MIRLIPLLLILLYSFTLNAQEINQEIQSPGESPFLLGTIDKEGLTSENYREWFNKNFNAYDVDQNIITKLAQKINDYNIVLFMGTWCGDSKREVPRFYKILEACDFPMEQLKVVAVSSKPNMYKQSPNHDEAGLNIHRVPTFIFYKDQKEVNRIVEHPVNSLEQDMLDIVQKNDYKSNYHIVTVIHTILTNDGLNGLKNQRLALAKRFEQKVTSMFELNTYGRILYNGNQNEAAIEVFKLNTLLFPDEPRVYMSLANTLGISGYVKESIEVIDDAIDHFPENEDLIENREALLTKLK